MVGVQQKEIDLSEWEKLKCIYVYMYLGRVVRVREIKTLGIVVEAGKGCSPGTSLYSFIFHWVLVPLGALPL